jgi:hypothetical protein
MDQYGTHAIPQMKAQAEALGNHLIFILKVATGKYHPLDKRTFAALKPKGRAKWRHEFAQHFGKTGTREIGVEALLQSESELSDFVMAACWDYSEEIHNDEDSESPNEDFELQTTTDTNDEDITMLQADILKGEEEEDE